MHNLSRHHSFLHVDAKETLYDKCYCYFFQVNLFSRIRLAKHFPIYEKRLQCIQARLQAISVLCKDCSCVALLFFIDPKL